MVCRQRRRATQSSDFGRASGARGRPRRETDGEVPASTCQEAGKPGKEEHAAGSLELRLRAPLSCPGKRECCLQTLKGEERCVLASLEQEDPSARSTTQSSLRDCKTVIFKCYHSFFGETSFP
ncbi:uncharacterized protein RBU33_016699 [Hipposideros larvatus]